MTLYRVGGIAAVATIVAILAAIPVFVVSPPPATARAHFVRLGTNRLLGLLGLDVLYVVSVALSVVVTLALCVALRRASPSWTALAALAGLVGATAFFSSNPDFSILVLGDQYAAATTETEKSVLLAAGTAALAAQQGTAYFVSYYLGAIAGLLISFVMLRSSIFSRATACVGIAAFALGLWPPVGTIGITISIMSVVVLVIWEAPVAHRLFQLAAAA